jgi:hypothetical protein
LTSSDGDAIIVESGETRNELLRVVSTRVDENAHGHWHEETKGARHGAEINSELRRHAARDRSSDSHFKHLEEVIQVVVYKEGAPRPNRMQGRISAGLLASSIGAGRRGVQPTGFRNGG